MLDELSAIQSRIQEIRSRISSLAESPPASAEVLPEPGSAQAPAPSFATALHQARTATAPETAGHPGIRVPAASLGPLPPMPVSPTGPNVVPIHTASVGGYDALIQTYASKHGLAPALVRAVIHTESGGNPHAVSRAGAVGLMQLMPANVQEAGIADPFDPEQNIAAGTEQLSSLMKTYHGDLDLALAGYNAGPGNVRKYGGVPPFAETQNYIRKVRAAMGKE